jgi:hypothetical protein
MKSCLGDHVLKPFPPRNQPLAKRGDLIVDITCNESRCGGFVTSGFKL